MAGGYIGRILRVDLTSGSLRDEPLPPENVLRKYIGGFGLATKILYDEVPVGTKPLDPENRVVFMTGPLTGTPVPSSSNCTVANLSHETGYTIGVGNTHGRFGAMLKFAGYDGIIFQGASPKPVYLWICEGKAELRDATAFWGKDTHDTEDLVKADVGEPDASVSTIGPAGENFLAGACVETDKYHLAAKGGCGAVLGAKKLKAVAVYGTGGVRASDPAKLIEVSEKWRTRMYQEPLAPAGHLGSAGLPRSYDYLGKISLAAVRNLSDPICGIEYGDNMVAEAARSEIRPQGCFGCPIACSYRIELATGPYAGYVATVAGGGEGMEGAAGMAGVTEASAVWRLVDLYDRIGLDSGVLGSAIALCFECYERGLLTKEQTGGLELNWGNYQAVEKLLDMAVKKEGLGKFIAAGPRATAEAIGGEALNYVVHAKGTGINCHDLRIGYGVLFGEFISTIGPAWQAGCADFFVAEPDLGFEQHSDPWDYKGKPGEARGTAIKKCIDDSLGTCMFANQGYHGQMEFAGQALGYAIGWEPISREETQVIGERVLNLTRAFNIKHGYKPEHDLDISPRLLEAPTSGVAKGRSIAPYVKDMILGYYRLMDWDAETGRPSKAKLKALGLDELIPDLYGK